MASAEQHEYGANEITVLEGLEAVRKRPGMYIGSTGERGLHHLVYEVVDNSVDEALAGYADHIEITILADGGVKVVDNGRGIPVDIHPTEGRPTVEVVMTVLHAGGKFGGGGYAVSGGLHGVGISVVNALSTRVETTVRRQGYEWTMAFADGGVPQGELVRGRETTATGTTQVFHPDPEIFETVEFDYETLRARFQQMAFLNKGLRITLTDERTAVDFEDHVAEEKKPKELKLNTETTTAEGHRTVVYQYDRGLLDYVQFLNASQKSPVIHEDVIAFDVEDTERMLSLELAMQWTEAYRESVHTYANTINTHEGGTHEEGFRAALTTLVNRYARDNRLLRDKDDNLTGDDIREGLTAVISVKIAEPQFEGQTKEILGTPAARQIVSKVVSQQLEKTLTSSARAQKQQAGQVLEKIVAEMKSRISARVHKETQRRKNALETSQMPAKLVDCRTDDVAHSELFIVEGDSALGTARLARASHYQALLPIRGKILNVQKASLTDMLANAECAALIQVIGAGSGRTFDLDAARYGKVVMMTDADVDGAHIRTLLLTLFYRYMRPLVEAGRVYAAVPPLHRVEIVRRGRDNEMVYTYSEKQLHEVLARLEAQGERYKEPIQRYKGLGEMDADQLAETTMDPRQRLLRRVRIEDAQAAERAFSLLMGSEVAPRKDFIISHADELDLEQIDA
ncbi:DNA gyrase/topoisomerase IV subunit B [Rothia kristinae]|uniref:DNA gyrase/topoisomerase IV subunit B n=1 Tax=Rothia kristinae TaxID=37923 RepID=UPI00073767B4|nr:DNA gyrase subunit B [Rothia kristinae]